MALLPWRTGRFIKIENETSDTKRFWIEVPELFSFDFKSGQFVTLDLPINPKPNKRLRSYSIASSPNGSNVFELLIALDKSGEGTPYLFNEIKIGSTISFRGPQGVFLLKQPLDKDVFMICTGTGIAPFRSMIHYINEQNIPHKKIYLIFGCRTKNDLLYFDEMVQLQKTFSNFNYIPVLSREKWEGHTGYVHEVYENLCANRTPSQFYLCGWKGMIDEAQKRIVAMNYDIKNIHSELYG